MNVINYYVTIISNQLKDVFMDKKVRGSFQMMRSTQEAIDKIARIEGRSFNNMLEQLAKRAIKSELK